LIADTTVISPYDGQVISLNKPIGITSFDAVSRIRHITGIRKVGHAGTLDPFAEGLLLVGIGRAATKRLPEFLMLEKEYIGRVVLGVVTDSLDLTGKVVETNSFEMPDEVEIKAVLDQFIGEIEQLPPMFSAVKINGRRLYRSARQGIEVERIKRKVKINLLELTKITPDGFEMRVVCSKGTYIRALADDIGRKLGMGAHLGSLIRTRIGNFCLEEATTISEFALSVTKTGRNARWN
jgi:tRNA pseudouridine55 synthase